MAANQPFDAHRPTIAVTTHAIAAGHYLAATAGFEILQAGGNAIDAGVAAGIALGILQIDLVDFAGVAPIMIYHAEKREVVTIAGLGTWPRALDPEFFMREHGGKIPLGVLRIVVPAAPDAWITALKRYGTMSFGEVAAASIRLARDGFPMYPLMAASIEKQQERLRQWPSSAAVMLPNGSPPQVGDVFRQTDLAASLQYMADEEKRRVGPRARGRSGRGARRFLPRRHRAENRRLYQGPGRAAVGRGHGELPFAGRAARAAPVRRSRRVYLRRLVPGADAAANPGAARRHRSQGARPQQRRLHPHADRGAETRLCRPRGLLHRPGCRQRAAADADLVGIRRRAAQIDPPGQGVARDAAAGPARRDGPAAAAPARRTRTRSPTPLMSAPPTAGAMCSRRRRATAPTARRWCPAPASFRPRAARSRAPIRSIRPASRPASGRA